MKYLATLLAMGLVGCSNNGATDQAAQNKTFGDRQFEQMLEDRPDMKGILPMSHPVVKWVIDSFNGKYLGQRIYWNANSPHNRFTGECYRPDDGMAFISITGGAEATPIDKWGAVVFELHNIQNDFQPLTDKALAGDLDENAYADECAKLEFEGLKKTRTFLLENPLPKSSHTNDRWYNNLTNLTDSYKTFEEYKKAIDTPQAPLGNNNFRVWRDYYESTLLPYVHKPDEQKNAEQKARDDSKSESAK